MKNAKASVIIYAVFSAALLIVTLLSIFSDEIPYLFGQMMFEGAYDLSTPVEVAAYGRIYILALAITLPMIIIPIGYVFTNGNGFKVFYWILQVVFVIGFYILTKASFKEVPVASGTETTIILGFIPVFGKVVDFFTNVNRIYVFYVIPIIIGLINYWLLQSLYLKDLQGNFVIRIILFKIIMGAIYLLAIPIILAILDAIGGLFSGIIGIIFVVIIFAILGGMFNSPRYTAKITDRDGNTHKVDIY